MIGFVLGIAATVAVSIVFPVMYAKFVAYVRSFWDKVNEDTTEVK